MKIINDGAKLNLASGVLLEIDSGAKITITAPFIELVGAVNIVGMGTINGRPIMTG
jgi:hypothetical protein